MSYINKRGSVCRSAAEKRELLEEYEESGESQSSFCARNNIPATTFYSWLNGKQKFSTKTVSIEPAPQGKFVRVVTPKLSAPPEPEDSSHHYFALNLRFGSILDLKYRRSTKCPTM